MNGWSVALLAVSGYVAVTALVRLMVRHRTELVERFRRELQSTAAGKAEQDEQAGLRQPKQKSKAA